MLPCETWQQRISCAPHRWSCTTADTSGSFLRTSLGSLKPATPTWGATARTSAASSGQSSHLILSSLQILYLCHVVFFIIMMMWTVCLMPCAWMIVFLLPFSSAGNPEQGKLRAQSWSFSTWQQSAVSSLSSRSSSRSSSLTPYWKVWQLPFGKHTHAGRITSHKSVSAQCSKPFRFVTLAPSIWERQNNPQWQLQSLRQVPGDLLQSERDDRRRSCGAVSPGEVSCLPSGDPTPTYLSVQMADYILSNPERGLCLLIKHTVIFGNKCSVIGKESRSCEMLLEHISHTFM